MADDTDWKREMVSSFGDAAESYLNSDVHREGADLDLLGAWCAEASLALDIACGPGHTAGALSNAGVETVIGVDVTPEMVRTAVEQFGVGGIIADAEALPFADDSVDAVTCRIAAHHFPDRATFLEEICRVLRSGGTFAFEDNAAPEDADQAAFFNRVEELRDPTHERAHSVTEWRDRLADAGFTIEETATMWKEFDYQSWVDRTDPSPSAREELAELMRTETATPVYRTQIEDGAVASISNQKVLIRATV